MNAMEIKRTTEGRNLTVEELVEMVNHIDDGVMISIQMN